MATENKSLTVFSTNAKSATNFFAQSDENIGAFINRVKGLKNVDDAAKVLSEGALIGRELWIKTAIVTYTILSNLPKSERKEAILSLMERLNYGKTYIHNFKVAGEHIARGEKIEEATKCNTVKDYLALFDVKNNDDFSYTNVEAIYKFNGTIYSIYTANKKAGEKVASKQVCFIALSGIQGDIDVVNDEDGISYVTRINDSITSIIMHNISEPSLVITMLKGNTADVTESAGSAGDSKE